jgi:hypothetical protein
MAGESKWWVVDCGAPIGAVWCPTGVAPCTAMQPCELMRVSPRLPCPLKALTPSQRWEINELTKMDVSRNSLTQLPEDLGTLGSFCVRVIMRAPPCKLHAHARLPTPPHTLPAATLTHLDVSKNGLQGLFASITNLQSLKLLSCEDNKLQARHHPWMSHGSTRDGRARPHTHTPMRARTRAPRTHTRASATDRRA